MEKKNQKKNSWLVRVCNFYEGNRGRHNDPSYTRDVFEWWKSGEWEIALLNFLRAGTDQRGLIIDVLAANLEKFSKK